MSVLSCLLLILFFGSGAVEEFEKRVESYAKLHEQIDDRLPELKKEEDPKVILEYEKAFAAVIRMQRPGARQGDIFIPGIQPILRNIIEQETTGEAGRKNRSMILGEGNPKSKGSEADVKLVVNGVYPSAAPLSTVPPSLLMRLPRLPDAVQYRFVGRALILWDTKAHIIVDFLPNAIR